MFGQTQGDFVEIIGNGVGVTAVNSDFVTTFDCSNFSHFWLSLDGTFTLTLQAQFTNDLNQPFLPVNALNIQNATTSQSIASTAGRYFFVKSARYLRIRCTAFTSNTSLIGVLEAYTAITPVPPLYSVVATPVSSASNVVTPVQPIGIGAGSNQSFSGAAQSNVNGTATAGTATATLAGVASRFTYITAMEITIISTATAGSAELSLTGLVGGTVVYEIDAPGVASTIAQYLMNWGYPGLQSSAVNTSIVATLPTLGAGTGKVSVVLHGYTL
jgi:hypothetical protein